MDYIVLIVEDMYLHSLIENVILLLFITQVSTHLQIQESLIRFICHLYSYLQSREREVTCNFSLYRHCHNEL